VASVGKVDPLDDRVPFAQREVELGLLDVDRDAREGPVLSAMIEMQMAVDDRAHRGRIELRGAERFTDIAAARSVILGDPFVALTHAGIDEDDAIAIAVQTLPPFLYAGLRFLLAGVILAGWLAFRGVDLRVSRRELQGAAVVGILMLSVANGLVVLAERTVPSGVAALIVASIPLW